MTYYEGQKILTSTSHISILVEPPFTAPSTLTLRGLDEERSYKSLTNPTKRHEDDSPLQPLIISPRRSRKASSYHGKPEKPNPRLITSGGLRNVDMANVRFSFKTLTSSAFQKLVNVRWTLLVAFFSASSLTSWLFFAFCWWAIEIIGAWRSNYGEQCVMGVDSFYSAMLFSIETQSTIGYGSHYISNTCYPGFIILYLQMVLGSILQSLLCAVVISKFMHPKFRRSDVFFSDNICIHEEKGEFVLSFRIADQFSGTMSMPEAHVRVYLIHTMKEDDYDGEKCMVMQDLDVGYDKGEDRVLLMVPWVVQHVIDYNSPLYNKGYDEIVNGLFEIVVILEGSVEETGNVTQCIKSYVAEDVLWGYTFDSMISKSNGKFTIDFAKLNSCSKQDDAPEYSAADLVSKKISSFACLSIDDTSESTAKNPEVRSRRRSVRASFYSKDDEDQNDGKDPGPEEVRVQSLSHYAGRH